MVRTFYTALIGLASASLLLVASPARACSANCGCDHEHHPDKVAATCNCSGPSDCTCKKGECKCSKCAHPQNKGATKKTELLKPLNTAPAGTVLPDDVKLDASAGVFI